MKESGSVYHFTTANSLISIAQDQASILAGMNSGKSEAPPEKEVSTVNTFQSLRPFIKKRIQYLFPASEQYYGFSSKLSEMLLLADRIVEYCRGNLKHRHVTDVVDAIQQAQKDPNQSENLSQLARQWLFVLHQLLTAQQTDPDDVRTALKDLELLTEQELNTPFDEYLKIQDGISRSIFFVYHMWNQSAFSLSVDDRFISLLIFILAPLYKHYRALKSH